MSYDPKFTYHILHSHHVDSLVQVTKEYFLFAEFIMRLLDYKVQIAVSNAQKMQYMAYRIGNEDVWT